MKSRAAEQVSRSGGSVRSEGGVPPSPPPCRQGRGLHLLNGGAGGGGRRTPSPLPLASPPSPAELDVLRTVVEGLKRQLAVGVQTHVPAALLVQAFEALQASRGDAERLVTTTELASRLGYSREWWAQQAPDISGAVQESSGSPWNIPLGSAKRYLERYRTERTANKRGKRGPWKAGGAK